MQAESSTAIRGSAEPWRLCAPCSLVKERIAVPNSVPRQSWV